MDSTALSPAHHEVGLCCPYGGACWSLPACGSPVGINAWLVLRVVAGGAFCGGCCLCGKFRVPIEALARFIPEELPWYAWWCSRF